MFNKSKRDEDLEAVISDLYLKIVQAEESSEEYDKLTTQLTKLYNLKSDKGQRGLSPDVAVAAAANLLGIMMIVGHERANVVTSKALMFLGRMK